MIKSNEKNMLLEDLEKEMKKEAEREERAAAKKAELEDDYEEEEYEEELEDDEEYYEEEEEVIKPKKKKRKKGKKKKKKPISATALFAAAFVFFLFIVVLLFFLLSLSGSDNPIFENFGIEPFEVKQFLLDLVNKTFMGLTVAMLLFVAVGIFRGYSLPKEKKEKRKGSFIFALVSGILLFVSVLLWGGAVAFVNYFVTEGVGRADIEILGFEPGQDIIAPLDIQFSAESVKTQFSRQGEKVIGLRWSKDEGKTYTRSNLNSEHTFQFFQKGIQTILLEVELLTGEIVLYDRSFTVDDASFILSPENPVINKRIEFDASALFDGSAEYRWDFDNDGIYERQVRSPKITNIFDRQGEQTVALRIEANNDSIETYDRTFIVLGESEKSLDAVISVSDALEGKAPYQITFNAEESYSQYGDIVQYIWRIEGSSEKKGIAQTYTFEKEGTYTVELEVSNENDKIDTEEIEIVIKKGNSPPNAVIISKPPYQADKDLLQGYIPFEASFYGHKSTDADENITQYEWKIIDEEGNETEQTFGDEFSSVFRKEGLYRVSLSVTDQEGEISEKIVEVEIKEPPVVPMVSVFPESGTAPLIVEFNASESTCKLEGCKILSYLWDFDDGRPEVQAGAHISHQFQEPGKYEVKMTALTNMGEEASVISYISVTDSPFIACFQSSRKEGEAPLTVTFDPTICSKGEVTRYKWDFGDGFISETRKPTHTFRDPGTYTVILNTFSKDGRVGKMEEEIVVVEPSEDL